MQNNEEEGILIKEPNNTKEQITYESNDNGLTQVQLETKYGKIKREQISCKYRVKQKFAKCCTKSNLLTLCLDQFPVIDAIRHYEFKTSIIGDMISGLSLGVMNIPQSLGYALLACVPPIQGMYTAFFTPLVYVIFGTSRHISMGVMALSSLLIADVIKRETFNLQELIDNSSDENTTLELEEQLTEQSVEIAVLLTFLCGIASFIMGILNLGFLTSYMGDAFVSGWFVAANIRVITSQVIQLLQLHIHSHVGPLNYFKTLRDIFLNITQANVASIIIAIVSFLIIIPVKYWVNEKFKPKLRVPIPIDLIVVIIITIVNYFGQLNVKFGVRQVDTIPSGLPLPVMPSFQKAQYLITDAILLAIVGYVLGYMMVKVFSERHNYSVKPNQELKAFGVCNIVGSIFSSIACSTSPPRCFFMEQTGGKSQIANVISALIILIFLLFAGPMLEPMPICVLNVIIISACVPMFQYYKKGYIFFKTNMYDFAIWFVSAAATLCLDINKGIIIGISFQIITIIFRTQRTRTVLMEKIYDIPVYVNKQHYPTDMLSKSQSYVTILKYPGPLYFATMDDFKASVYKQIGNPLSMTKSKSRERIIVEETSDGVKMNKLSVEAMIDDNCGDNDSLLKKQTQKSCFIIDASCIPFMDTAALKMLGQLQTNYSEANIKMLLACCCDEVCQQIRKIPECRNMWQNAVYVNMEEALKSA